MSSASSFAASSQPTPITPASHAFGGKGWYFVGPKPDDVPALPVEAKLSLAEESPTGESSANAALEPRLLLSAPSKEARAALVAVPRSGAAMKGGKGKKGGKKGKFVVKVFNPQATRPQPTLSTPYQEFKVVLLSSYLLTTTSTIAPVYVSQSYRLQDFDGYASLTSVFDEYKVEQLETWLEPSLLMSSSVGSCIWYSAIDLDDANAPTSAQDVDGRQGCATSESGTAHYHKWKPYVANALYSGAFTSYGSEPAPWIDCASAGVYHYGLKACTNAADGVARAIYATTRMLVSFRGPTI